MVEVFIRKANRGQKFDEEMLKSVATLQHAELKSLKNQWSSDCLLGVPGCDCLSKNELNEKSRYILTSVKKIIDGAEVFIDFAYIII